MKANMYTPVVSVKNLTFRYGEESVLEDVSFEVPRGEYLGIVGPNGSGKTTLLRLLLGLIPLEGGEVSFFGEPREKFRDWHKIGYVPQYVFRGEFHFPATVREIVESGHTDKDASVLCQLGLKECAPIDEALRIAQIEHLVDRRIDAISGGERQRVFIARALVSHPELLILDEPTAGVDVPSQEAFYDFLKELNEKRGLTIMLVSHDPEIIAHEAKTALALNQKVVYHGPVSALHTLPVMQSVFGKHALHHTHS